MKTIGLLGGMSWVSSLSYYKWLNEMAQEKFGAKHPLTILMSSVNWERIQQHQRNSEWDKAGAYLADEARKLEQAGAGLMLIGTNTMHKVADDVQAAIDIPLLHIADATAKRIKDKGLNSIALLGTKYTMVDDFYKGRLIDQGIDVLVPNEDDIETINTIIFDELCCNIVNDNSRQEYIRITNDLFDRGAQGVILGCTEIVTLVDQSHFEHPVFDTTMIHVEEAFKEAIGE